MVEHPQSAVPYFMKHVSPQRIPYRAAAPLRGSASRQLGSFRQFPLSLLESMQIGSPAMVQRATDASASRQAQRSASQSPSMLRPGTLRHSLSAGTVPSQSQSVVHRPPPPPPKAVQGKNTDSTPASRLKAAGLKIMAAKRFEASAAKRATEEASATGATGAASTSKRVSEEKSTNAVMRGFDETLSAAALQQIASTQDALAAENEEVAGAAIHDLTAKLGELLEKKFEIGMKSKDFFEQLDRNGDGKVSKMEWRQCMRDLGITGAGSAYDVKEVDALFLELDKDASGELELREVNAALKKLRAKFNAAKAKMSRAAETAQKFRARAAQARDAAGKVEICEEALAEFKEAVASTGAELKLGVLLARRGVKPADAIANFSASGTVQVRTGASTAAINMESFCQTMSGLTVGANVEELKEIFHGLDVSKAGQLDVESLQTVLRTLNERRLRAAETEKKLAKALAIVKDEAITAQQAIKLFIEEDARNAAEQEQQQKLQQKSEAEAALRAKEEAEARAAAVIAAKEAQKAEFEARIRRRRMSAATPILLESTPTQESAMAAYVNGPIDDISA